MPALTVLLVEDDPAHFLLRALGIGDDSEHTPENLIALSTGERGDYLCF